MPNNAERTFSTNTSHVELANVTVLLIANFEILSLRLWMTKKGRESRSRKVENNTVSPDNLGLIA